jgi:hypothetical protein
MTEYSWQTTYERACDLFKARPNAEQEQATLDAFRETPRTIVEHVDQIGLAVATGNVRSGWAVLRKRISTEPTNLIITDTADKQKRTQAALNWIANAGLHFDNQADLEDTLFVDGFGEHGQNLRAWATDTTLRAEMIEAWKKARTEPHIVGGELRPSGEELERLDREYFERLNANRAEVQAALLKARGGLRVAVGLQAAEPGACDDCEKTGRRFHYGKFLLCSPCAATRQKVAKRLASEHLPGDLSADLPLDAALSSAPLSAEEAAA